MITGCGVSSYRNRHRTISQNVLVACNFNLEFMYVLSGWEGLAHDSKLLTDTLTRRRTAPKVPQGKYYLVDCGFPNRCQFLAPFQGVRYHLYEFGGQGRDPAYEVELFNLCRASLRNVMERIFAATRKLTAATTKMSCDIRWEALPKLKLLKKALRRWNWEVFGDIALNVTNANEKVMLIQDRISTEGFSDDLFRLESAALVDLNNVLKQQETFLKEKSRVRWLAEGDWNSKFFHSLLKRRGGNKPLSSIQFGKNISYDPIEIGEHISSFY
ncbi:hypothetical protein LWI28_026412 [Acer negundo]|uniref:DDE Tnp4 domain-containing protein n=1 Tax=Acer negundo TaxID=4023 RepID=A0AAD5J1G6_ACENE|nr:hypothetical protein LWI28_026412 [Acer negundo]